MPVIKGGRWSLKFDCCQDCETTERPHASHGRCSRCAERARYWADGHARQRAPRGDRLESKRRWRKQNAERINAEARRARAALHGEVHCPLLGRAKLLRTYELDGEQVADVLIITSGRKLCGTPLAGMVAA